MNRKDLLTRTTDHLARALLLGMGVLLCAPAWAQECESSVTPFEVAQRAEAVENSWLAMNLEGTKETTAALVAALPCVDGVLTPRQAARVHRALGLARIVERDLDGAALSFSAARYADPGLGVSEALAPSGTPVRELFVQPLAAVPDVDLDRPRDGVLVIDGSASTQRPGARPVLLQHVDGSGSVTGTWLIGSAAPLPEAPWDDPRKGLRRGLQGGAAGAGVAALALLGAAALTEAQHQDSTRTSLSITDLERLRTRSRRLTVASGVVGAAAIGTFGLTLSGVLK